MISKYLWRKGYLRTPESCSVDENAGGDLTNCRASCPAEIYEALGMTSYDVLVDTNAMHWVAHFSGGTIVSVDAISQPNAAHPFFGCREWSLINLAG